MAGMLPRSNAPRAFSSLYIFLCSASFSCHSDVVVVVVDDDDDDDDGVEEEEEVAISFDASTRGVYLKQTSWLTLLRITNPPQFLNLMNICRASRKREA